MPSSRSPDKFASQAVRGRVSAIGYITQPHRESLRRQKMKNIVDKRFCGKFRGVWKPNISSRASPPPFAHVEYLRHSVHVEYLRPPLLSTRVFLLGFVDLFLVPPLRVSYPRERTYKCASPESRGATATGNSLALKQPEILAITPVVHCRFVHMSMRNLAC